MASRSKQILSGLCAGLAVVLVVGGCASIQPQTAMVENDVRNAGIYFGLAPSNTECAVGSHSITVTGPSSSQKYEFCANSGFAAAKRLTSCLVGEGPNGDPIDKEWCGPAAATLAKDFDGASWLRIHCNNHDSQHEIKMANGAWVGVCDDHISGDPQPAHHRATH